MSRGYRNLTPHAGPLHRKFWVLEVGTDPGHHLIAAQPCDEWAGSRAAEGGREATRSALEAAREEPDNPRR